MLHGVAPLRNSQSCLVSDGPGSSMALLANTASSSSSSKTTRFPKKRDNLPSPALCCACGMCVMLAGVNITLVGAFAFGTFVPTDNPPIIIGPFLLVVAFAFFTACCVFSRRKRPASPAAAVASGAAGGNSIWGGLMKVGGGAVAFEMETSEHTLPDTTTAVQLSSANSLSSSSSNQEEHPALLGEGETRPVVDVTPNHPSFTSDCNGSIQIQPE